jgi:hypothetical protein
MGGLMVKQSINLNGNGVYSDSYDSSDPTKSSNGLYNSSIYSGDYGDIFTDGGITDGTVVSVQNSDIYGRVHTGPGAQVIVGPNGGVGTHVWLATNTGFEPGYVLSDANFTWPNTTLPSGPFLPPNAGCVITTNYSSTNLITTTNFPDPFPPGGVQTNLISISVTNLPSPIPPGITTNTTLVTSNTLPSPIPSGTVTNFITTPTTTASYPAPDTYIGSVTTNYSGNGSAHLIKSYSYNLITGYTYTYPLYAYTYSYFTYTYDSDPPTISYTTNCYSAILLPGSTYKTTTLGSGPVLVRASSPPTNATLILTGALTGIENIVFEQGARLVLYCDNSITLNANQITNPNGNAQSFIIYGTTNATSVALRGNGTLTGLLIAPYANVSVSTAGNNPLVFCGALVANSFTSYGNFAIHFDESLAISPPLPARIISQPQNQEVVAGQNAAFSVSMSPGSFAYQWYFGASLGYLFGFSWGPIPGATNSTLALTNVDQTDIFGPTLPTFVMGDARQGAYYVTISNYSSVLTSSVAYLTVHSPPSIAEQPRSQYATLGSSALLWVSPWYLSDYPWSFQWRQNGTNLPSATNYSLVLSYVNSNSLGNYDVVFSNPYGSVTSQTATVTLTIAPDFLWAVNASNSSPANQSYGPSVAQALTSASGQPVIAGIFYGPGLDFGEGVVLTNNTPSTPMNFLCWYDSTGSPAWAINAGTNSGLNPWVRLGMDSSDHPFLAGSFSGSMKFNNNVLITSNTADIFIGEWGQNFWARQIQAGDPVSQGFGFAVDPAGNVFVASRDSGTADFGSLVLTNSSAFLAKYDNNGNLLWATEALPANAIALGTNGSVYLAGQGVLAKYDTNASLVWSRDFPNGLAIATDSDENLYVTGYGYGTFDGFTITNAGAGPDFFVAKCDSSGNILWLKQAGSIYNQAGSGICVDRFGDVFVSSLSRNKQPDPSLSFDSITMTNVMGFVAEFDSHGRALAALTAANSALFWAVAGSSPDAIYAGGDFFGSANFGSFTLTDNHSSANGEAFLTKLAGLGPAAAQLLPHLGSQFQFDLAGASGFPYVIESSTNLTDWLPLTTNVAPSTFTDPNAPSQPFNYYRAVYRP